MILRLLPLFSVMWAMSPEFSRAELPERVTSLIESGSFAEAERLLAAQIPDPEAPVTSEAAIQLEVLRRTRHDFSLTAADVLAQIQAEIPDATATDVLAWRDSGDLQSRVIDGELRFFRRAVSNLYRFNSVARQRRQPPLRSDAEFDLTAHIEALVALGEVADGPEIHPVKHHVRYELSIVEGHSRLVPGAIVRAWLPYPREYRQQRDVRLIRSDPPGGTVSRPDAAHRTIYFQQQVTATSPPPRFVAEYEFVTSAYCPRLDLSRVQPYDVDGALYREYTSARPPHIVFTPKVQRLAREIVGDEANPLEKARRVFRWVSANVPWCAEMEYSIIENLSAKGLSARRGDCGVQGLTFITLCRAAGVPARWQSGWQTRPGDWNMHDWSEFYVLPWGWLPADASYGVRQHDDPRVRDFLCGNMDPYRMIVSLDYARPLDPEKISFRSEPNDFQRGEVEIDGHNLYFDEWNWKFQVTTQP